MHLFTSDIDWAPEEVIEDTVLLFTKYGVKCTFFCTHQSSVLDSIRSDSNFELAIHPNFLPLLNEKKGSLNQIMDDMLSIVPEAKGVRSHSLVQSSRLSILFKEYNLEYQANTHLPYKRDIAPYKLWNGLVEVMHNFEDDIHFLYGYSYDEPGLELYTQSLNLFSFHPVHIYLNTDSEITFQKARSCYKNPKELIKLKNKDKPGTRDLLIRLLEGHHKYYQKTYTVHEYIKMIKLI